MTEKVKVGIFFNAKDNLFINYLKWIVTEFRLNKNFELTGIYTNDESIFTAGFIKSLNLNKNFNYVIENSDIVFSLGYWKILKKNILDKIELGVVNFHNSYNLKYKGRHCSTWVIKNNEDYHGSTMHFIDEKVDEGKIIDTRSFKITNNLTAEDLFTKASQLGLEILKDNFYDVIYQKNTGYYINNEGNKTYTYRKRHLNHEISTEKISNETDLLREVRSLTFDNKPSPYIVLNGFKVYLKMENYDHGILEKQNRLTDND
jgi:methionyl-tRNA formyltransferase